MFQCVVSMNASLARLLYIAWSFRIQYSHAPSVAPPCFSLVFDLNNWPILKPNSIASECMFQIDITLVATLTWGGASSSGASTMAVPVPSEVRRFFLEGIDLSRMSGVSRIKCWTLLMIPVAKKLAKPFLIADHTAKILFDQGLFFFPLLHFRTTPTNSTALINDAESKDPPKIDSAVISCHDCATDSTIEPWFERPLTTSRRLQHPEPSKTMDPPLGKGTFPPPCAFSTSMPTKANFCNHLNGAFVVESGSDRLISTIWKVKCIIANTEIAEASKANCLSIVHCMSIVYLK